MNGLKRQRIESFNEENRGLVVKIVKGKRRRRSYLDKILGHNAAYRTFLATRPPRRRRATRISRRQK